VNDSVGANAGTLVGFSLIFASGPVAGHPGDFDGDGDVDGADFVVWQTNFPLSNGAFQGDGDGDGDVDGADFVIWQTNFPFTSGAAVSPVPEPAAILLCLAGCAMIAAAHRRRS
jgi:hypothetical protein